MTRWCNELYIVWIVDFSFAFSNIKQKVSMCEDLLVVILAFSPSCVHIVPAIKVAFLQINLVPCMVAAIDHSIDLDAFDAFYIAQEDKCFGQSITNSIVAI